MTTLKQVKLPIPAVEMNGESTLPLLCTLQPDQELPEIHTAEDDELWFAYGGRSYAFPYKNQDNYSRELTIDKIDGIVLENEYLRATFTPQYGGKLWSLFDKKANKELLFANHVYRPAFLALRNAWTSGGVEWNCGAITGHHPHTCDQMFTAVIDEKDSGLGCPVLRMYHYERIRSVVQQMDFYLPEDSRFLHCRMRVFNPERTATEMYWWSNIATPTDPSSRVVMPAVSTYANVEDSQGERRSPGVVPLPVYNNVDVTYPTNNPIACDYFFKLLPGERRYVTQLNKDGYGLVEASTQRLQGRKLFVWGRGNGGKRWQEFLSGDDARGHYQDGCYNEIQCGLAKSQYESIPMPPQTAWEWVEYYGAMQADPAKIHGEWEGARNEVRERLDEMCPIADMEKELKDTHKMATSPATKMLAYGDGWAALEDERRAAKGMIPLSAHLDFGKTDGEQEMWRALLQTGTLRDGKCGDPSVPPVSYQVRPEWLALLEKAAHGADKYFWLTHYELGCAYMAKGDLWRAEEYLASSCKLSANAWNTYATAELYRLNGNLDAYGKSVVAASRMCPSDNSLVKMSAAALCRAEAWNVLLSYTDSLTEEQKKLPRVLLYRAIALAHTGDLAGAEAILYANGGLEIPDYQEGEVSTTALWAYIEKTKAEKEGKTFDEKTAVPPHFLDFRMFVSD